MKYNKIIFGLMLIAGLAHSDVPSNMAKTELTSELRGSEGNKEAEIDALIKKIDTVGYSVVAANKNIQVHYYNKYKEKNVEMISFFGLVNKEKLRPLLLQNPDFGAYAPFNFLVYKVLDAKDDNTTWYGHIHPDTMLDIIGEKDVEARKSFTEMVDSFDTLVTKEMQPTKKRRFERTMALPEKPLIKLVKKFEEQDDLETFVEDFVMQHDGRFSKHDFIIAGFIDFKFEYADMDLKFDKYDAYWVSMLCHFKFSNSVFNRGMPQAGMFAPCSVYFYIPKGKNELHVGYASVDNWVNSMDIKDQAKIDDMRKIDAEVVEIFKEMGFEVESQSEAKTEEANATKTDEANATKTDEANPLEAEVAELKAKIKKLEAELLEAKESMAIGTDAVLPAKTFTEAKLVIGSPAPKSLSAYYAANPQTVGSLKGKLEANGFKVLAITEPLKGKTVLTITNDELQKTNSFLATLNVLVNGRDEIRVQNPSYFGAAYLKKDFQYGQFKGTLTALQAALGDMYEVQDKYEFSKLTEYQFMFGMPHLEDTIEVGAGSDLLTKLTGEEGKAYVAYTLTLPNGSTLVGHTLRSRTNTFLNKIGAERNTNLLPYQVMIKEGKAVILDPKYYLALSLPLLNMTEFMKIASAPDEIEKDIKRVYK